MKISKKEIFGLILLLFSLLSFITIIGYDPSEQPGGLADNKTINTTLGGYFGVFIPYFYHFLLGYASISIPIITSILGAILFTNKKVSDFYKVILYISLSAIWTSTFLVYLSFDNSLNLIGHALNRFIGDIFGRVGFVLILYTCLILLLAVIFNFSIYNSLNRIYSFLKNKLQFLYVRIFDSYSHFLDKKKNNNIIINDASDENYESSINDKDNQKVKDLDDIEDTDEKEFEIQNDNSDTITVSADQNKKAETESVIEENDKSDDLNLIIEDEDEIIEGDMNEEIKRQNKYLQYKLPDIDFLDDPIDIKVHNEDELKQKADQVSYALNSFGVSGKVVKISPGPVITLFEIEPAEGVRVNKFTNLSEDLSRIMGGKRVRIIAPIPGSKSVGIELPNESPSIVYMKSILNSKRYIENKSKLKIALGKTTTGDAFFFELNKMPHLLVAGATGAGKSVCINTIIVSILYNAKPDEVKFILMDPKKVELTTYKSLVGYHLITAKHLDEYVMTTAENSVSILSSAITEMERRFQVFSDVRVRNLDEYNKKKSLDSSLENIPYLVVVIDELADLMMTSGRAIEEPITRLAQKARAVGLHLIVATQRPSVDVITGLIKSNFPARISFQVSSKVDSRTIIDQMGAEKLLGRGDMLFLLPGSASPIRIHNAFITLDEIEKIMSHISAQPKPDEIKLPEIKKIETNNEFDVSVEQDEYLKDAAKLVVDSQQASVSLLQRRFRIGYSRAGRLIDELESLGIISGYSGSKARDVLVDHAYLNEIFGE
ncbi:MAG: hypothetical protein CMG66_02765 [Candidatus Marinimicrobia bacterium]|nr:hypothetical protein [Candidatus Neomarinimicrobiota bacterium]|tara:strand:- start:26353 stop:28674 length:2322 start_codon:yes stop_codon:yes gene_type:complete